MQQHSSFLRKGEAEPACAQVVVWTTWAIIATLLLLGTAVFNLFPDYASQTSWCASALCSRQGNRACRVGTEWQLPLAALEQVHRFQVAHDARPAR
jgi:hypothetical protein